MFVEDKHIGVEEAGCGAITRCTPYYFVVGVVVDVDSSVRVGLSVAEPAGATSDLELSGAITQAASKVIGEANVAAIDFQVA